MDAPRTWWIDEPFLLAGANPDNGELGRLRLQGFRVAVSLLEEDRQPPRYAKKSAAVAGWSTHCAPIREGGVPSLHWLGVLMAGLRTHAKRTKVFVHCESGQGRAALVGAAYWISKGLTVSEAVARVAQAGVAPGWATEERKELLRQWRSMSSMLLPRIPPPKPVVARRPL